MSWSPSAKHCQSLTRRACIILQSLSQLPVLLPYSQSTLTSPLYITAIMKCLQSVSITWHFVYLKSFLESNNLNYSSQLARCPWALCSRVCKSVTHTPVVPTLKQGQTKQPNKQWLGTVSLILDGGHRRAKTGFVLIECKLISLTSSSYSWSFFPQRLKLWGKTETVLISLFYSVCNWRNVLFAH